MKKKWKLILGIAGLLIVAIMVFYNNNKPIETKLLEIKPQNIAKTFKEEGKVVADAKYPIYSQYGGVIKKLSVEEGQSVKKGDILLELNTSELSFQLEQLKGELASLEGQRNMEAAKISLDRLEKLFEIGAISEKELEDARNTVESQYYPGLIDALDAQIGLIEYRIAQGIIKAPVNGVISEFNLKKGMYINPGSSLMMLFQKEKYSVEVFVLTEDVISIMPDSAVELIQENKKGDIQFSGIVKKIAPAAEEKVSTLGLIEQRIKITIQPEIPEKLLLRPGYALDVRFTVDKEEDRLVVPKTALFPYEDKEALWVVRDGKAEIQPVSKGFENQRDVVILEGLQEGDSVVLNPKLEGIEEGKKIIQN